MSTFGTVLQGTVAFFVGGTYYNTTESMDTIIALDLCSPATSELGRRLPCMSSSAGSGQVCSAGNYVQAGGTCVPCQKGYYSCTSSSPFCFPCAFVVSSDATSCFYVFNWNAVFVAVAIVAEGVDYYSTRFTTLEYAQWTASLSTVNVTYSTVWTPYATALLPTIGGFQVGVATTDVTDYGKFTPEEVAWLLILAGGGYVGTLVLGFLVALVFAFMKSRKMREPFLKSLWRVFPRWVALLDRATSVFMYTVVLASLWNIFRYALICVLLLLLILFVTASLAKVIRAVDATTFEDKRFKMQHGSLVNSHTYPRRMFWLWGWISKILNAISFACLRSAPWAQVAVMFITDTALLLAVLRLRPYKKVFDARVFLSVQIMKVVQCLLYALMVGLQAPDSVAVLLVIANFTVYIIKIAVAIKRARVRWKQNFKGGKTARPPMVASAVVGEQPGPNAMMSNSSVLPTEVARSDVQDGILQAQVVVVQAPIANDVELNYAPGVSPADPQDNVVQAQVVAGPAPAANGVELNSAPGVSPAEPQENVVQAQIVAVSAPGANGVVQLKGVAPVDPQDNIVEAQVVAVRAPVANGVELNSAPGVSPV